MPDRTPRIGAADAAASLSFLITDPADAPAVAELVKLAHTVELASEDVLLAPGATTPDVLLLVTGLLEIRAGDEVIERLEPGQCIVGQPTAGLGTDPARLTVVAAQASSVVVIAGTAVDQLRESAPASWGRLQGFLGRQVPSVFLATLELFRGTDPASLSVCDEDSDVKELIAGDLLVRRGDPADEVYVVLQGTLAVIEGPAEATGTVSRLLGRGHMSDLSPMLLDEPHSSSIRAARDSEVIRITRDELDQIVDRAPAVGLRAARLVAQEMRRRPGAREVRTIALLTDPGLGAGFADELTTALALAGRTATVASSARVINQLGPSLLSYEPGRRLNPRLLEWLVDLEDRYQMVVYLCDEDDSSWTRTAVRQADVVLVVADVARGSQLRPLESDVLIEHPHARVELVLVHPPQQAPSGTDEWLDRRHVNAHHHLRVGEPGDLDRLARTLVGTDFGVALSGGGARGFAHIGAFKALAAHGIVVDHVGGTSMGSVIAGEYALGWSVDEMTARNRKEFPAAAVVGDMTLPVVSLGRGRSSVKLLRNLFGEAMIEDQVTPYFCVSTNLSRAETVVHDRGLLWLWSRASSSVPGIGPPVPFGGELLVDGGVLNNLPADVLRHRCHGPILAVDVGSQGTLETTAPNLLAQQSGLAALRRGRRARKTGAEPTIMQILTRATTVSSIEHRRSVRRHADLHVIPEAAQFGPFDWAAIDAIVEAGYRATTESLQRWEAAGRPTNRGEAEEILP
jgi:predicted acylesterase/phospholipase RssA/CRP-like cAMP-binding protein